MKCEVSMEDCFYGAATVGDRGQVVIPMDARKKLGINSGDKMLVMSHPSGHGLILCKIDAMREVYLALTDYLQKIDEGTAVMTEDESA